MERAAGLAHDDTAQVKLDKLDALLAQTSTSKQDAALFAELSLPNETFTDCVKKHGGTNKCVESERSDR